MLGFLVLTMTFVFVDELTSVAHLKAYTDMVSIANKDFGS